MYEGNIYGALMGRVSALSTSHCLSHSNLVTNPFYRRGSWSLKKTSSRAGSQAQTALTITPHCQTGYPLFWRAGQAVLSAHRDKHQAPTPSRFRNQPLLHADVQHQARNQVVCFPSHQLSPSMGLWLFASQMASSWFLGTHWCEFSWKWTSNSNPFVSKTTLSNSLHVLSAILGPGETEVDNPTSQLQRTRSGDN